MATYFFFPAPANKHGNISPIHLLLQRVGVIQDFLWIHKGNFYLAYPNPQPPFIQLPSLYVLSHILKQCERANVSLAEEDNPENNPTSGKPECFSSSFGEEDEGMKMAWRGWGEKGKH